MDLAQNRVKERAHYDAINAEKELCFLAQPLKYNQNSPGRRFGAVENHPALVFFRNAIAHQLAI